MYYYKQWRNSSSLIGRTSDFSTSMLTGHSSKGSTDTESPSWISKDVFCLGNVCLFQPHCGPSPRTSGDPMNDVTRAQIHVLAGHVPRHWRNVLFLQALRSSSSKTVSQGNTALVASSNKTFGAHLHRLRWSTSGMALSQHYGHLPKASHCYFNVKHDVPANGGNTS